MCLCGFLSVSISASLSLSLSLPFPPSLPLSLSDLNISTFIFISSLKPIITTSGLLKGMEVNNNLVLNCCWQGNLFQACTYTPDVLMVLYLHTAIHLLLCMVFNLSRWLMVTFPFSWTRLSQAGIVYQGSIGMDILCAHVACTWQAVYHTGVVGVLVMFYILWTH